jgi:acetyl esterase
VLDAALGRILRATLALPPPVLRRLAGPPRVNDRGAALDLEMQALLGLRALLRFPQPHEQTPVRARTSLDREARIAEGAPAPVARVEERTAPGPAGPIPLRVYVPRESGAPLPVLVFYHAGGHVIGSLESHDGVCRALARDADCVVVAVDYRLAPEHRFPAAFDDAVAAFEHVVAEAGAFGGHPDWIAVGGDSAGGNLAAALCHRQRDARRARPALQLLIYPPTDLTRSLGSHQLFRRGLLLDAETIDWFVASYLSSHADERDPRASPLWAPSFTDLPPAIVVTAGFDPLRDEGEAYAGTLRAAGVAVVEQREASLPHGFVNVPAVHAAAAARARIARSLRDALYRVQPARLPASA